MINEADGFESGFDRREVGTTNEEIDVLGIADRVLVDAGHPLGDGIAADDGVRHAGRVQRAGCPSQPFLDFFRRHQRPFPTNRFDCRLGHDSLPVTPPIVSESTRGCDSQSDGNPTVAARTGSDGTVKRAVIGNRIAHGDV